jgi:hypothetical protein
MAVLLGAQMIAMGFLAELFIAYHIRRDPPYSIAERAPVSYRRDQGAGRPPV